jgi:predicted peroxiredoxin
MDSIGVTFMPEVMVRGVSDGTGIGMSEHVAQILNRTVQKIGFGLGFVMARCAKGMGAEPYFVIVRRSVELIPRTLAGKNICREVVVLENRVTHSTIGEQSLGGCQEIHAAAKDRQKLKKRSEKEHL